MTVLFISICINPKSGNTYTHIIATCTLIKKFTWGWKNKRISINIFRKWSKYIRIINIGSNLSSFERSKQINKANIFWTTGSGDVGYNVVYKIIYRLWKVFAQTLDRHFAYLKLNGEFENKKFHFCGGGIRWRVSIWPFCRVDIRIDNEINISEFLYKSYKMQLKFNEFKKNYHKIFCFCKFGLKENKCY